jgi:uncharacterized protein
MTPDGLEVIDADGHVQEPSDLWDRFIEPEYFEFRPRVDHESSDNTFSVLGQTMPRMFVPVPGRADYKHALVGKWNARFSTQFTLRNEGFSSASYLVELDREGIDQMILYPSRGLYACAVEEMDPGLSAAICRAYNRWLAEFCATDPERLLGVALTALHGPEHAAAEARYAVEQLGMHGCMVRPNPCAGRTLEDPANDVYFAEVERLGVPLALHEGSGSCMPAYGEDRFDSYLAHHAMSHPMEQMAAVFSLTVGGILERHPRLRVAILEAGGTWLPYWLYRLDEHVEFLDGIESEVGQISRPPSEYFRRQCWISCEPSEPNLRTVIDAVGADRILWASDYPHPDCKYPGMVDDLITGATKNGLTADEIRRYAADNAKTLYGLA